MKIKKAFLIYPPTGLYMRDDRCQAPVKGMTAQPARTPLDLLYMASTLENTGVVCKIKDYPTENKDWADFENDLKDFCPDMLVISITTPTMVADLRAAALARKINREILVVSKGAHYLANDQEVLNTYKDLDVIIRGECEFAVADIATADRLDEVLGITYRDNDGVILKTPDRPFLDDLDKLPFPARYLLNNNLDICFLNIKLIKNHTVSLRCFRSYSFRLSSLESDFSPRSLYSLFRLKRAKISSCGLGPSLGKVIALLKRRVLRST